MDVRGAAIQPDGCIVVETEIDLLRALRGHPSPLLVRGKSLGRWACALWEARGWHVRQLFSPVDELLLACPDLSYEEANLLLEHHGRALALTPRPLNLRRVSEAVFPSDLWRREPSLDHAARWLLWLDETDPPAYTSPIVSTWALRWRSISTGPEVLVYEAVDARRARELLAAWLGYAAEGLPSLPAFPVQVPDRCVEAAEEYWLPQIIKTKGRYFDTVNGRSLPVCMVEKAAELVFQYYRENPADLTEDCVRGLADHILPVHLQALRSILPPPPPADAPSEAPAVVSWFRNEYLFYRQWAMQANSPAAKAKARDLCSQFSSWYLSYYPSAIARGDENIIYFRSAKAQSHPSEDVVLLVILDGLSVADAATLLRYIRQHTSRMTPSANDLVFSPIPTVTEICKPAIICGCAPRDVSSNLTRPNVQVISEGKDPTAELEESAGGDIFVWTLAEPDRTYHSRADRRVILHQVDAALRSCAARISEACQRVPSHLRLKVIVTSDHGRLFEDSERLHAVPSGMVSHQRAAWGPCNKTFPATGFSIETSQQIAYLNGPRFGVSNQANCAIVLSEAAFHTNDGKTGVEQFAHGGLFPEEVIVPWIEMLRDAEAPAVSLKATGKAREGGEGKIAIEAVNSSRIALQVVSVDFIFGRRPPQRIHLEHELPALSQRAYVVGISDWPSRRDALSGRAAASLRPPGGPEFRVDVELAIDSEGFYVEDVDILGDLS